MGITDMSTVTINFATSTTTSLPIAVDDTVLAKEVAHELAAKLYESAAAGAPGDSAPGGGTPGAESGDGKKDDVIDAEFEESN